MKVKDIYYSDAVAVGDDYLAHHGIKGMRWGVRRYQNEDGTYTSAGKKRRTLKQMLHDNRERQISKIMAKKHVDRKTAEKIDIRNRVIPAVAFGLGAATLSGIRYQLYGKENREAKRIANGLRHSDLNYGDHYLAHHGIRGQKWGVRRYQNEDGTLTEAGKKRYATMDDRKLYKTLRNQVYSRRAEMYGSGNQWMSGYEIGEKSKKLRETYNKESEKYRNSEAFKKADQAFEMADRRNRALVESGKISMAEYDKRLNKLTSDYKKSAPSKNYTDLSYAAVYRGIGRPPKYLNDFIHKGGASLSVARIEDLGFSKKEAEDFVKRMARSGYTLGAI